MLWFGAKKAAFIQGFRDGNFSEVLGDWRDACPFRQDKLRLAYIQGWLLSADDTTIRVPSGASDYEDGYECGWCSGTPYRTDRVNQNWHLGYLHGREDSKRYEKLMDREDAEHEKTERQAEPE